MNIKNRDTIKKLIISLIMLLSFIVVVFAVNILVDPANLVKVTYEKEVAKILAGGKNATNMENLDDRELIKQYLDISDKQIDILALGSSRSMQLTKDVVGNENFFVAGVTGAELRDCINIYYLFKKADKQPKKVILFTEFWFFSQGNLDPRADTQEYENFCREINSQPFLIQSRKVTRLKELLSFPYFQNSIKYLLSGEKRPPVVATDKADGFLATRRYDGSYSYEESYRLSKNISPDNMAKDFTVKNSIFLSYTGNDEKLCFQFEKFIEKMQEDGVEVELVISPFHPIVYDYMANSEKYKDPMETEKYFHEVAKKYNIPCYGSYNPSALGLTNTDFYDAQHPNAQAIYKYYGVSVN